MYSTVENTIYVNISTLVRIACANDDGDDDDHDDMTTIVHIFLKRKLNMTKKNVKRAFECVSRKYVKNNFSRYQRTLVKSQMSLSACKLRIVVEYDEKCIYHHTHIIMNAETLRNRIQLFATIEIINIKKGDNHSSGFCMYIHEKLTNSYCLTNIYIYYVNNTHMYVYPYRIQFLESTSLTVYDILFHIFVSRHFKIIIPCRDVC